MPDVKVWSLRVLEALVIIPIVHLSILAPLADCHRNVPTKWTWEMCISRYDARMLHYEQPTYPRAVCHEIQRSVQRRRTRDIEAHQIYSQELTLPESVLLRSRGNTGDPERMHALFRKLRSGQPIKMVVLGGSIACGGDTSNREQQWSVRVFRWLNRTYPHEGHEYINSCKPGTPSMLVAACLNQQVPDDADFILFEFTVNDSSSGDESTEVNTGGSTDLPFMENERRRGFERLLRKLLKLPNRPALLYLHVYQPEYMSLVFWKSAEMQVETVLQYYGIPSVSARNALYHLHIANVTGFAIDDVHCGVHPSPLGHRYYADMLIAALQDIACGGLQSQAAATGIFAPLSKLPDPMLKDNWDFGSECLSGKDLASLVVPEMTQGWQLVDEGKRDRPKWGYRTLLPDTSITLQVDTRSRQSPVEGDIILGLGYLSSYAQMGSFSAECAAGCTCQGVPLVNATQDERTSIYKFATFPVSQHEHCQIKVTSLQYTASTGHKVKIDTLMVATEISSVWAPNIDWIMNARGQEFANGG